MHADSRSGGILPDVLIAWRWKLNFDDIGPVAFRRSHMGAEIGRTSKHIFANLYLVKKLPFTFDFPMCFSVSHFSSPAQCDRVLIAHIITEKPIWMRRRFRRPQPHTKFSAAAVQQWHYKTGITMQTTPADAATSRASPHVNDLLAKLAPFSDRGHAASFGRFPICSQKVSRKKQQFAFGRSEILLKPNLIRVERPWGIHCCGFRRWMPWSSSDSAPSEMPLRIGGRGKGSDCCRCRRRRRCWLLTDN